jgi:hypothetical protein
MGGVIDGVFDEIENVYIHQRIADVLSVTSTLHQTRCEQEGEQIWSQSSRQ